MSSGTVSLCTANSPTAVASGPRCATTGGQELICSHMVQAALGLNDFCPVLVRSSDHGNSWSNQGPIWPHLRNQFSIFGSISVSPQGDLYFYGTRTLIHAPGESNWCETTQGLKDNELIWARSTDDGRTWSEPMPIPMPFPGAAEAPGAICIARDGTWHACFAPYNTFDPAVVVPRNQVVLLSSSNEGQSWRSTAMLRFRDEWATAAEAWIAELADGRLLSTCWNLNQLDGVDLPNAYAISSDGGATWCPTHSTGILGQATALTPLPDGSALFVYCKRRQGRVGVWLAHVQPTDDDFGVQSNEIIWEAPQRPVTAAHNEWTRFTFGEPSATLLEDGSIMVLFWCLENGVGSIQYVRLKSTHLFF